MSEIQNDISTKRKEIKLDSNRSSISIQDEKKKNHSMISSLEDSLIQEEIKLKNEE